MEREHWDLTPDAVEMALTFFAPHSMGAIVREAFYGTRRFDDFVERTGLTRSVLAGRLRQLVDQDMVRKIPYREAGQRERYEYVLSPRGEDLIAVVVALRDWSVRWLPEASPPTLEMTHAGCGANAHAVIECDRGHRLRLADLESRPGPGARRTT